MIVNNLDLLWSSVGPHEADPPLIIDPDAVLASTIAFQHFQPIAGRKFFLSDELFDWVDGEATGFVGLFLWHADGTFDELQVEPVNRAGDLPPGQAFSAGADDLVDKYLRQLGEYTMEPITVEPFTADVDGVMFGWEIGQYPDGQYYVGIRPGDFVVYYAPWDGEEYDT